MFPVESSGVLRSAVCGSLKSRLQRPYTFIVLALLLLILGPLTILRTPTDIFPNIGIPVVSVVWRYSGMPAGDMGNRMVSNFERALTTTVNDIEHIESQSLSGVGCREDLFPAECQCRRRAQSGHGDFADHADDDAAGERPRRWSITYNASTVPVIQLALSSNKISEQEIFDLGNSFIRTQLATVQGAALPYPYGAKSARYRSIWIWRPCGPGDCRPRTSMRQSARRT